MRVFLSGPMGAGKSTLAGALAERLGLASLDLDRAIEERAGRTIAHIFATDGERAFRELEREVLTSLLDRDGIVVALGGGTVTHLPTRRELLQRGIVITLRAPVEALIDRVGSDAGRPLLAGDPKARLTELIAARRDAYAECHGTVWTDGDDAIERMLAIVEERPVAVPLGVRSYVVEIGSGIRHRLMERLRPFSSAILVADENTAQWRDDVGVDGLAVTLDAGEPNKHIGAVERIWDLALARGVDRAACVVAIGGGVVGDLAGFAAATLMRGVSFGQVPTSLLAMVDSSVGGKTGFNRDAGKNLVGAFHQPRFVLCDVDTLATLPAEERISGLAEVVKSAWLDSEDAVLALEEDADALRAGEIEPTMEAIRRSVALKSRIVADDEREAGARMLLNLGHTVGHALEAASDYQLRHGEAVSLGLVAAARLGRLDDRLPRLLQRLGLPTDLDAHLSDKAMGFLHRDKKRQRAQIQLIIPGEPGKTRIEPREPTELIRALRPD